MPEEIPPPPLVPRSQPTPGKAWFYAGPIIIDSIAIICTTILVALQILPVENFKYLIGALVIGNVALRIPGANKLPPGGGGIIIALLVSFLGLKGYRHG